MRNWYFTIASSGLGEIPADLSILMGGGHRQRSKTNLNSEASLSQEMAKKALLVGHSKFQVVVFLNGFAFSLAAAVQESVWAAPHHHPLG